MDAVRGNKAGLGRRQSTLFARKRFQFAGAMLLGALIPWSLRGSLLPGVLAEAASLNALTGNAVSIIIAFWTRLSIET